MHAYAPTTSVNIVFRTEVYNLECPCCDAACVTSQHCQSAGAIRREFCVWASIWPLKAAVVEMLWSHMSFFSPVSPAQPFFFLFSFISHLSSAAAVVETHPVQLPSMTQKQAEK